MLTPLKSSTDTCDGNLDLRCERLVVGPGYGDIVVVIGAAAGVVTGVGILGGIGGEAGIGGDLDGWTGCVTKMGGLFCGSSGIFSSSQPMLIARKIHSMMNGLCSRAVASDT